WGKLIRYSVTASLTTAITITPPTLGKTIQTRDSSGALTNQATNLPIALLSFGAKNFGTSETGQAIPDNGSATNLDEEANNTNTSTNPMNFITRPTTENTGAIG